MIFNRVLKFLFISLSLISTVAIVNGQNNNSGTKAKKNPNASEITFEKTVCDFGSVVKKADCNTEFVFKNTGKSPLILYDVKPSCDCTTPFWPKEPVMPGKTGTIKVVYDTKETGVFSKTITVTSNASASHIELTIQGEVYEP
jgi:hypothetical protein